MLQTPNQVTLAKQLELKKSEHGKVCMNSDFTSSLYDMLKMS